MFKSLDLVKVPICKSTQEEAREGLKKLAQPKNKIFWFASHKQSEGRGRQGHKWIDQGCESLLISASFLWNAKKSIPPQITLLAGYCLWSCLYRYKKDSKIFIKWPNDIVAFRKNRLTKLGGILCEVRGKIITIGWGLNLKGRAPLKDSTTVYDIYSKHCPDLEVLSHDLIKEFTQSLNKESHSKFWEKLNSNLRNKAMKALWGKKLLFLKKHRGVAIDLDMSGALLLKKSDKKIHLIV